MLTPVRVERPTCPLPLSDRTCSDDGDEALFQKLRALRLDIARELGKPPYIVFSDKTLRDMVRVKPITDDQFLAVNGVGESKLKQYGERFMAAIREDSGDEALTTAITDAHCTTVDVEPANRE